MWLRTVEAWPVLLMAAIANGAFRVGVLIPRLGDYRAHVVSTLMLAALILGMTVPIIDGIGIGSFPEAVVIGLVWVVLTLAFEFLAVTTSSGITGNGCWRTMTCATVASGPLSS